MRRSSIHPAMIIGLIFGLAIGLIPALPVYGDNLQVCQGTGTSSVSLKFGGRVVSPTTILRTANGQACAPNETGVNMVTLTRTLTISPNGTPVQNGIALLQAMSQIVAANPSEAKPWLLKLEPGNYDLTGNGLILSPFVDLEGSGEGVTVISSTISTGFPPSQGTVTLAANSEIRQVQVRNVSNGFRKAAVVVPANATNVRMSQVNAIMQSTGGGEGYALFNNSATTTNIQNSRFLASGATTTNFGIRNEGGTIKLLDSSITGQTSDSIVGIFTFADGTTTVLNSNISVSGGTNLNYAATAQNVTSVSTLTIQNSTLSATGPNSYGIVNFNSSVIRVGASGVSGGTANTSGTMTCIASWTGSFGALSC